MTQNAMICCVWRWKKCLRDIILSSVIKPDINFWSCREGLIIMHHGFTLIEMMVVVAIIGILAAIAIPGFLDLIRQSKTSEARVSLNSIRTGASTYFQAEHVDANGITVSSHLFPSADAVIGVGHPADETTRAQKFPPGDATDVLKTKPWTDLHFTILSPFYFYYNYDAKNDGEPSFQASASASLSDPCDAIFVVEGRSNGRVSGIIDWSKNASKCNLAVAPTAASANP